MTKTPPESSQPQPDARARAAMPWLDPSPPPNQTPDPTPEPQAELDAQQAPLIDPVDPDAKDLPPGVILPEAATFRLHQIKAQVVNFAAMTLLALLWTLFVIPDNRQVGLVCVGITGAGTLLSLLRFYLARRSYLKQHSA